MAKLGNEAKLIVRLARERMKAQAATKADGTAYSAGYAAAVEDYNRELLNITVELER